MCEWQRRWWCRLASILRWTTATWRSAQRTRWRSPSSTMMIQVGSSEQACTVVPGVLTIILTSLQSCCGNFDNLFQAHLRSIKGVILWKRAVARWVCDDVDLNRVEICRDRRSCKICASCVNFPGKQRDFSHNLRRTARFTHTKCDFALKLLKFYTLS